MTVISVGIGYAFKSMPDALESSLPIGKYLAVATMLWFGLRTLQVPVFVMHLSLSMWGSPTKPSTPCSVICFPSLGRL